MSRVEQSSRKPGDDLDGLLRTFFRSQMPQPWPVMRVPPFRTAPSAPTTPTGRSLMRSRWTLAASVALLLLGSLGLTGRFTHSSKDEANLSGPLTSDTKERKRIKEEHKIREFENKNHPGLGADDRLPDLEESEMPPLR